MKAECTLQDEGAELVTHRYAEIVVKGNWHLVTSKGAFMLQASPQGPVYYRTQGMDAFQSADTSWPTDRLQLLAYLETKGWEVLSTHWGEGYMIVLARRNIYESEKGVKP